jgi:16S rRNA (adenine1518-N6/adenine1519-N6)-dimethyltransferase
MVDQGQVQKIVASAEVQEGDLVLEVGPGLGSLTLGLLDAGAEVIAIEFDKKLAEKLPITVENQAKEQAHNLTVHHLDALKFTEKLPDRPIKLVSNLPYNVGVPILLTLLQRYPRITDALVLVQLEVAKRLVSEPGNKVYGIPSCKLAWYGRATLGAVIPRSAFWPVPRVDSQLVKFTRYTSEQVDGMSWRNGTGVKRVNSDDVFTLINLAFSQRRKTLRSLLVAEGYNSDRITKVLDSLQVDPMVRGEVLSIEQFAEVARLIAD